MSFEIMTDSSANFTPDLAEKFQLHIIPLHCSYGGKETPCYTPGKAFDGKAFYDLLRDKASVKTSMVNVEQFKNAFEPLLQAGKDILYVAMSSGISGTYAASLQAAQELLKKYPGRAIRCVDTLAASFGEGLFAIKAETMRKAKQSLQTAYEWIEKNKMSMCQFFTVDDLMFLRRGGRLSGMSAIIGSLANIKPLLRGDDEGKIVACGKTIGRKKSLQALADYYNDRAVAPENEIVAIAHGDCEDDALYLAEQLRKRRSCKEILIRTYEPGTGAHVGPGAVALFFFGTEK